MNKRFILLVIVIIINKLLWANDIPVTNIKLAKNMRGLGEMSWSFNGNTRNYIDADSSLGNIHLRYKIKDSLYNLKTEDIEAQLLSNTDNSIQILFRLKGGLVITQQFSKIKDSSVEWDIALTNKGSDAIKVLDFSFTLPFGKFDNKLPVYQNLNQHTSINGNASFCYWIPYSGTGNVLVMTMLGHTSLEYMSKTSDDVLNLYINAGMAMDNKNDSWRIPASSSEILPGKKIHNAFRFQMVPSLDSVRNTLYENNSLDVRVAPGMTVPNDLPVYCLLRSKQPIKKITPEFTKVTTINYEGKKNDHYLLYKITFSKLGENLITVEYGSGNKAYLNFFSTEPLETLTKKRATFITAKQQIKDSTKWYNGLYSIWDMEQSKLLSPDDKGLLPDFVVGGSDDPSNCKPLYVSEKNVVYPDSAEIASLEYYEKNFVWGKLQRTGEEYPYPYGIYGSENWYENRMGKAGGYNSGGWGKERMWRTFDYTTHIAIYYNLYKIAKNNPGLVHYLTAKEYLERAYQTAMAFFLVPYNIEMGKQWSFHGWADWAYKQGNFHERYIVELINELKQNDEMEKADVLRREWEKKVKYFIYDDPWPFGSEFETDRTAFESSFYIAKYAKDNVMQPQEQLWYDKNKKLWYSHLHISDSATEVYMQKQLDANLALRGSIEPQFNLLGTAWASNYGLDYMSQMGGVAILDYALNFSTNPSQYINTGYNSLLSSWALMNTGNKENNFGYWYPGEQNDGAVGWVFTPWQHSTTYFKNIPAKRGVWRYDGEIDHGLVGAIHGALSIVVEDPFFGLVGYGCIVVKEKDAISIIPKDGVGQRACLLINKKKIFLQFAEDGFLKGSPVIISDDFRQISFSLENRQGNEHNTVLSISGLEAGVYEIYNDNNLISRFNASVGNINTISIPVKNAKEFIKLVKR